MRIVIDMQGAQTDSRFRGIGRYTMAFAQAVVRNRGEHEVILVLNGLFPETIGPIRDAFDNLLRQDNILVWYAPGPVNECDLVNNSRREIAELIREAFCASLQPDIIHISSLFEGYVSNAVTSVGCFDTVIPVSVTLYDLIPLVNARDYLLPNPSFARHYHRKIDSVKRAKYCLAISEFSRQEAISHLALSDTTCINVSTAIDPHFQSIVNTDVHNNDLLQKFGLTRSFLLCAGGADPRKNLARLIQAYAKLPIALRASHQLLFVGKMLEQEVTQLKHCARSAGLQLDELIFIGYVTDDDLVNFYNLCKLYIFPSWHEGFGLPALEAMACGAPVIASNTTSLPEVIGLDAAMFDPLDVESIANKIVQVLEDEAFRNTLLAHGSQQSKLFSWHDTAKRAIAAWENGPTLNSFPTLDSKNAWLSIVEHTNGLYKKLIEKIATLRKIKFDDFLLQNVALNIAQNEQQIYNYLRRGSLPERLVWRLEGPFDSSYSLALVNREMARALFALGHQVALHSTDGPADFEPSSYFLTANPDLAAMHKFATCTSGYEADVTSRNLYPPRVSSMHSRMNTLHAYGWEESGFPLDWVDEFNQNLQGMTVMSNHVKKIMVDHGVTVPVVVSSLGVDHWLKVEPDKQYSIQAKSFRFLHVSSCFPRKGADVLLRAYGRAFRSTDDVTLIIKTFANPHNEIHKWLDEAKNNDPHFPDVHIIETDLTDAQLKALYSQCDALVAPSRAEGFGLPMAEGMLSGLAVITTGWSGQTDFCTVETAWLIDYQFERARSHFGLFASAWAEPDENHLVQLLQEVHQTPVQQRNLRIETGKKLLLERFCWSHVASRVVQAARQWSSVTSAPEMRIAWVTTWNIKCGIAAYSEHLINNISQDVTILAARANSLLEPDGERVNRCWSAGESNSLEDLSNAVDLSQCNILVIQFNYGFFELEAFSNFLNLQIDLGRKILITLHATSDPVHIPHKKLSILSKALKRCEHLLVHSISDLNRLKKLDILNNVTLFPLGVLDYEMPVRSVKLFKKPFTIVSYGYFLPHKGLLELIDAMGLLRANGFNVNLVMVNAEYPIAESTSLIEQAKIKISALKLQSFVTLYTDYLSDEDCLIKLTGADLVVYPYQQTAESASAAVRYGMASGKPVAVTPLNIFEDVAEATYSLQGFTPDALAQGILDIEKSIRINDDKNQTIKKEADSWREQYKYSRLGNRLSGILKGLSKTSKQSLSTIPTIPTIPTS